jgi:hypothetical protein
MRTARSHRPDVPGRGLYGRENRGHVELGIVRQDAHRIARAERLPDRVEVAVGPRDDDLVRKRKALAGREDRPGVAHRDAVTEHLGDAHERGGEVDGAEDDHLRRRRERLDEHRDLVLSSFAVRSVMPRVCAPRRQLAERIAGDDPIEVGIAERSQWRRARTHEHLRSDARTGDHRRERHRFVSAQRVAQGVVEHYQSSSSTSTWMVPPHVRPTLNASSSEMP